MKRLSLSWTLSSDQCDDIRKAFVRLRVAGSADELISHLPHLLKMFTELTPGFERMLRVSSSQRLLRALDRDIQRLEVLLTELRQLLSTRPSLEWVVFGNVDSKDVENMVATTSRLLVSFAKCRDSDSNRLRARNTWLKPRLGGPRREDRRMVARALAGHFLRLGLPLTTTPSGLFASVLAILDPAGITPKHSTLRWAIDSMKKFATARTNQPPAVSPPISSRAPTVWPSASLQDLGLRSFGKSRSE